jgi:hypothetical protein
VTNASKIPSRKRAKSQDRELEKLFRQAASFSRKSKRSSSRVRAEEEEHSGTDKRK